MESFLTESPLIACVVRTYRDDVERVRYAELRNPPSERTRDFGVAINPKHGAPRELVVKYAWPGRWRGTSGMQPPPVVAL